jgi:hypothetical protein
VRSRRVAPAWHQQWLLDVGSHSGPRLGRRTRVLLLSCLALAAAACSAAPAAAKDSPTTTSSSVVTTSSSVVTTTTAADSQAQAVLAAYRAGWAAFEQATRTANAFLSALPATMVNPELQSARRILLADAHDGIIGRGTVTLHPRLLSITGKSAVVVDCVWDASELVYKATGKPVPPVTPPQKAGVRATLVEVSAGHWKVAVQYVNEGKCAAGY